MAYYESVCDATLLHIDHKKDVVQKAALRLAALLPEVQLEAFLQYEVDIARKASAKNLYRRDPPNFQSYSKQLIGAIINIMRTRPDRRPQALCALGNLASAIKNNIFPYVEEIMPEIEGILAKLPVKGVLKDGLITAVCQCLSKLAGAVGRDFKSHTEPLLATLYNLELSDALVECLQAIASNVPELGRRIQRRVLDMVSQLLQDKPYQHPGDPLYRKPSKIGPPSTTAPSASAPAAAGRRTKLEVAANDDEPILLALRTLRNFDFNGVYMSLTKFTRDCVVPLMFRENSKIRQEACMSTAALVVPRMHLPEDAATGMLINSDNIDLSAIAQVLSQLITVGISDRESSIRQTLLRSLEPHLDPFLAKVETLKILFVCLHDVDLETRKIAISIVGRLTNRNPAYIMPTLRKLLSQLLNDLSFGADVTSAEASAELLAELIRAAPRVVHPYVEAIVDVLIPKLNSAAPPMSSRALLALGDLAQVAGSALDDHIPGFITVILKILKDQLTQANRENAVRVLGQLCQSSGYVVQPYDDYPGLMSTLFTMLSEGKSAGLRRETVRVLGILGALDPWREKMNRMKFESSDVDINSQPTIGGSKGDANKADAAQHTAASGVTKYVQMTQHAVGTEDFYQELVVSELLTIAYEPSLSHIHDKVIRSYAIMVVKSGLKFVPYLPKMIAASLHIIRASDDGNRHLLFNELGKIVKIFGPHMRLYLRDIIDLVVDFWLSAQKPRAGVIRFEPNPGMHTAVMGLLRSSVQSLGGEFKMFLPAFLKHSMIVLAEDNTADRQPTLQVFEAFCVLGGLLDDWLPSVVCVIIDIINADGQTPVGVRKTAIETLTNIAKQADIGTQSSSIVHTLTSALGIIELQQSVFALLAIIMVAMGREFVTMGHLWMVEQVIVEKSIVEVDSTYRSYADQFAKGEEISDGTHLLAYEQPLQFKMIEQGSERTANRATQRWLLKLAEEACDSSSTTNLDWNDWMNRFNLMLFKECRSTALAACQELTMAHTPFARKLFNAAFVSCWAELDADHQALLSEGLEKAMNHNLVFMQLMLSVAEFMSHGPANIAMPVESSVLGHMGMECHAYAKALRYKEEEFAAFFDVHGFYCGHHPPPIDAVPELLATVEDLIRIHQALQEPEAAQGILAFLKQQLKQSPESIIKASWYEKLGEWQKALDAYNDRLGEEPQNFDLALGSMRCLDSLGQWHVLHSNVEESWDQATDKQRGAAAEMACSAAAGLGKWDAMDKYLKAIPETDFQHTLFGTMLSIHRNEFKKAEGLIRTARGLLEPVLTSLWRESYSRGYSNMVKVQLLTELCEVIKYKKADPSSSERQHIPQVWRKRLEGCQHDVDVWLPILKVRSLVLSPEEDMEMWLKYCSLCRHQAQGAGVGALGLERSRANLVALLRCDPSENPQYALPNANPSVTYAYIKFMWMNSQKEDAIDQLYQLIDHLSNLVSESPRDADQVLLARCYHKVGQWQSMCSSNSFEASHLTGEVISASLDSFARATSHDLSWYKAWQAWANMSYEAVNYYERNNNDGESLNHANMAITGFFNSIGLCEHGSLQDTLRLLTLWFKYGGNDKVTSTISAGLQRVSIDTWLQVLPQLIARIQIDDPLVRDSIHEILLQVGRQHTQAVIFPLTVAAHDLKSANVDQSEAAKLLLDKIFAHSPDLVQQAQLVSQELIRVAILWREMWNEGLEEASKLYTEWDIKGMFAVLTPLHEKLSEVGPNATAREKEFIELFGKDLREAWEWCRKYQRSKNNKDLVAGWDHYYHVYRMINKTLPTLTSLNLSDVSPLLFEARQLQLVVPGTYLETPEPAYIDMFVPKLIVIHSKQRPRRLSIRGTDGIEYEYLLKAHEDLRQDERVMQLFGLVNTLLKNDSTTAHRHLDIRRFFVLPLSPNLGLIKWVPTCETLHLLIRQHRERNNIVLNAEVRHMVQLSPDYDMLTTIQKVEIFRHALAQMPGDDIAKVMWLQSGDSETWLDRRIAYTRSLAVMSMVGYILGLGDRHPSNLMVDRVTGGVMHVDFGDCFEVAMSRSKFPEKVPFRLTRMLIKAMEVAGIEGNFRITCENVMNVMRTNADSMIAVLEAFVHDPLIDWFKRGTDKADTTAEDYAVNKLNRIKDKLAGQDFDEVSQLDVHAQVDKLIENATAHEKLAEHYTGWCPFW